MSEQMPAMLMPPETRRERTDNPRPSCSHENQIIGWHQIRGGRQLRTQCTSCGDLIGPALSHRLARKDTPEIDEVLWRKWGDDWWDTHRRDYQNNIIARSREWWVWYNEYLRSEAWREKRRQILERDGGICQGCRCTRAVHVHHLTYDNVGDELLFQLISLCETCHDKTHKEKAA